MRRDVEGHEAVTRKIGKPAIMRAEAINTDSEKEFFTVGDIVVRKFDVTTIDRDWKCIWALSRPIEQERS